MSSLGLVPPPGSGYAGPEYEINELPDSYEPMMEYPGTMRPGRTPENMPFHDLPIGDDDPDPVPWPHFQQIEVRASGTKLLLQSKIGNFVISRDFVLF